MPMNWIATQCQFQFSHTSFNRLAFNQNSIPLYSYLWTLSRNFNIFGAVLFSFAADICIRKGNSKISEEDVRLATDEVEIEFIRRSINMLGENQKILLYCILTVEDKTPTNIYRYYNMKAKDLGSSPLTHRRLSALLRELELMGLAEIERRGKGRARGVVWRVYPPSTIERETMLEVISRSL
jgi:Cdc6-like AAA superfamily ATPase